MKEGNNLKISFQPSGVCAKYMEIQAENGYITNVIIKGGCRGNTQGISKLVEGMAVEDVIEKLEGIKCGHKDSSCPAELAKALKSL